MAVEQSILVVFQPQRGGMFIGVEQQKIPSSVRSGIETRHAAPLGLCFSFGSFTINMPLLTELGMARFRNRLVNAFNSMAVHPGRFRRFATHFAGVGYSQKSGGTKCITGGLKWWFSGQTVITAASGSRRLSSKA